MKKIYIIPGMGESCTLARYTKLSEMLKKAGYFVVPINPDWKKPISAQCIKAERGAIIFGFSMGAVLAYLSAQKYPCQKIILASISPIQTFIYKSLQKFLREHMTDAESITVTRDILGIKINLETSKTPYVTLMGEKEKMVKGEKIPDFIVPKATHLMDRNYTQAVIKLLG